MDLDQHWCQRRLHKTPADPWRSCDRRPHVSQCSPPCPWGSAWGGLGSSQWVLVWVSCGICRWDTNATSSAQLEDTAALASLTPWFLLPLFLSGLGWKLQGKLTSIPALKSVRYSRTKRFPWSGAETAASVCFVGGNATLLPVRCR